MKTRIADTGQKFHWMCALMAACALMVPFEMVPCANAQSVAPRISSEITSADQSTLKDSLNPLAQSQFDVGRMPADTRLNGITLVFNRSTAQEAALQALIAAQQNPASPLYHQWLNPDQFAARFGMSDADLNKAQSWLEQQGFSIDRVARSKNAIHFTGTVRQVEQAFSTEMHFYKINGTQHFAPSTALSVPSALAPTVLGIQNLNDFRPKSHVLLSKNARVKPAFTSSVSGDVFFAPGDIATVYDIEPLHNASVTGAGQSITIIGQSAVLNSDIEAFQNAAGLTVKDPTPFVVPNSGTPTVEADGDEAESDLDLEWSGAMAPGATINFVYVGNDPNYGAFDSLQYAIDEKIGTIISSSYGECEAYLDGATLESSLEQGTAQGQTIMSAAGDAGSTDCFVGLGTGEPAASVQEALAVDYPASSAYVTGMGGTEISSASATYDESGTAYWAAESTSDVITSALQYIPEMAWNDDEPNCGQSDCLSAGGGGASTLYTTKPAWQTGVPGIPADSKRDVPDLALYASPDIPGYLFCSSDTSAWESGQESSCSSGFRDSSTEDLTLAGGTSFDAPIFSGILALINQKQGYDTGQGLINPTLYSLAANSATYASAFHDITTGNNDCTAGSANCASGSVGFSAGVGYDQVTGLGSVDATNLATAWPANSSTSPALIDTTTTITASNSAPTVGASDTFTITVTAASGTVVPSGTVNLTVDGGTAIPETLLSNGTYVYTTSFATAGSHTILATYAGDSTFSSSNASVTVNVATVSSGKGTIALTSSPTSLSVSQGASGTETITITPSGGYTGSVVLTFDSTNDTALQNLCWEWANENTAGEGTIAITGTAAVPTTLTLDTNASDCASTTEAVPSSGKRVWHKLRPVNHAAKNDGPNGPNRNPVPLTVAFAGLLLAGFLGRGSRKLRALAGLILLAAVGLAVTACGGSVTTTVSDPPKGSYTITVTGQDSTTATITSTQTFTLVID